VALTTHLFARISFQSACAGVLDSRRVRGGRGASELIRWSAILAIGDRLDADMPKIGAIWSPGGGRWARVKVSIWHVTLFSNNFQRLFTERVFERGCARFNSGLFRTYGAQTALANRCPSPDGLGYVSADPPGLKLFHGLQVEPVPVIARASKESPQMYR
jgi:hypothetical protein